MKKKEDLEAELNQKQSTLAVLRSLMEHPGWRIHCANLKEQSDARKGEILLTPLATMDSALAQEFMKGEVTGLALAEVMPFTQMEVLKHEVKVLTQQVEEANATEKARADGRDKRDSRVDSASTFIE